MPILQYPTAIPMTSGLLPQLKFMLSTDNIATVTAAGYLNGGSSDSGAPLGTGDVIMALYSYNAYTGVGTFGIFTVTYSNGSYTLVDWANAGNVLLPVVSGDFAVFNGTTGQIKDAGYLPSNAAKTNVVMANGATIANHIATYTDTAGTVGEDAATAINGGNIQAGLSGTAGTVASFPSTATKGSLVLAAVANTGNTLTTISNAAMGQASVVSIPDPGAATANFILSASAGAATQHITSGGLEIDAGALISGIATGGQVGTLTLYPTTASKGSLSLNAIANTGNTATIIQNAAYGQATTLTIPDPGGASANIALIGSITNGNFPQATATAGVFTDSGISANSIQTYSVNISLNQAAVQAAYATPFQIVAAPGSGKVIVPIQAMIYTNFQTSAFATGGVAIIQYDSTVHGAGTNALAATIPAAEITAASSQIYNLGATSATVLTGITNKGIFFSNQTQGFTGGSASSTVVINLVYQIITATV